MPFSTVKNNARERFSEVLLNLSWIESSEPKNPTEEASPYLKIQRGLYYVHLYSALEKTINDVVEHSILSIKSKNVSNKHYELGMNVLSLNAKMQAFKSCGFKEYIRKSIEVFTSIESDQSFNINNTIFSTNLQNIWFSTIKETLESFGIPSIEVDGRVRHTVDEIVEKRNAVAHGRETALSVGERYRAAALRVKTNEIQLVSDKFIDAFEIYIINKNFIKREYRTLYI